MKRFNLLTKEIDITYHDAALKLGMSDSAMVILYTVCSYGGECLLSDMTSGVSKQTINSALRKLEADGVVRSEVFEGRKKKVHLTEKGRRLAKDTVYRVIEIENEIFASWSDEEKRIYIELTQRYVEVFKEWYVISISLVNKLNRFICASTKNSIFIPHLYDFIHV